MDKEFSMEDPTQLLEVASDFTHYPGVLTDAAARDFLKRFPLPAIIKSASTLPLVQIWNLKLRESIVSDEFREYKPLHSSIDAKLQAIYKSLADLQKQGKSRKSTGSSKRLGEWLKAGLKDAEPVANVADMKVESSLSQ